MSPDDPRHGTDAGYQRHRKDGEPACGLCRVARADKVRTAREDPIKRKRAHEVAKAGNRATWRLVAAHRAEYERLYAEELAALRPATEPARKAS